MKIAIIINIVIVILVMIGAFFLLGGTKMFQNTENKTIQITQSVIPNMS